MQFKNTAKKTPKQTKQNKQKKQRKIVKFDFMLTLRGTVTRTVKMLTVP